MNHSVTFQPCLVAEMIDSTPQRIGIYSQVAHTQGFEKQPESFQIVYQISEYQANKLVKPCYFCYLLWQLARFCCGSWRVFVVAVGAINRLSFNVCYIKTGHRATVLLMQKSRMWFLCPVVHNKRGVLL